MAQTKLHLTCTLCGSRFVQVKQFSKRRDAQSYEDWAKENLKLCPDCFKNRIAREKDLEFRESIKDKLGDNTLIFLTGSPKQIAWGTAVRQEVLSNALSSGIYDDGFWALVNSIHRAEWWIENRNELYTTDLLLIALKEGDNVNRGTKKDVKKIQRRKHKGF